MAPPSPSPPLRVLAVTSDPATRATFSATFTAAAGFETTAAVGCDDAVLQLIAAPFDVVVAELCPTKGAAAVGQLRRLGRLPVVVCFPHGASPETVEEARRAGADQVVPLPRAPSGAPDPYGLGALRQTVQGACATARGGTGASAGRVATTGTSPAVGATWPRTGTGPAVRAERNPNTSGPWSPAPPPAGPPARPPTGTGPAVRAERNPNTSGPWSATPPPASPSSRPPTGTSPAVRAERDGGDPPQEAPGATPPRLERRPWLGTRRSLETPAPPASTQAGPKDVASPSAPAPGASPARRRAAATEVVVIGSSAGGPATLAALLRDWRPEDAPPIIVAQHLLDGFTAGLVASLATETFLHVRTAIDGARLARGTVYIAPGGSHLAVRRRADGLAMVVTPSGPQDRFRPSVDHLFLSAAGEVGAGALAILLTGMGEDGAEGLAILRRAGAATFCEDPATAKVRGMPAAAVSRGAAEFIAPIEALGPAVARLW